MKLLPNERTTWTWIRTFFMCLADDESTPSVGANTKDKTDEAFNPATKTEDIFEDE